MQGSPYIEVPIYRRDGTVKATFTISPSDAPGIVKYRWKMTKTGHIVRNVTRGGKTTETMHVARFILGLRPGDSLTADHINRDPADNRRDNLRAIPKAGQAHNRHRRGGSKYRGVWPNGYGKWVARCQVGGKNHYLGTFDDEHEAGRVAREFRLKHMPYAVD